MTTEVRNTASISQPTAIVTRADCLETNRAAAKVDHLRGAFLPRIESLGSERPLGFKSGASRPFGMNFTRAAVALRWPQLPLLGRTGNAKT
jgi:hypothetical protein